MIRVLTLSDIPIVAVGIESKASELSSLRLQPQKF